MQQPPKKHTPESPLSPITEAVIMFVIVTVSLASTFYIHNPGESIWRLIFKTMVADLGLGLIVGLEIVLFTPRKQHFNYASNIRRQHHITRKDKYKHGR